MNDNPLFHPLNGPVAALKRVGFIYWESGTVRLFLKLAILFVVPATCLLLALVYTALHHRENAGKTGFWDSLRYYVTIMGSQSLIRSSLGAVAEGAIAVAVADLYLQRQPRWFSCLQKATSKVILLLLSGMVAGLAIVLGYLCGLVPGIFLNLNFLLVTPVIILEDEISVLSSLGRSWDLVKGHRWLVLQCVLGLDGLYWLSNLLLRHLLKSDNGSRPFFTMTFHVLAAFPKSMFVPALGILKTILYIHLVVVKEHLTEERFASQIDNGMADNTSHVPLLGDQQDEDIMQANFDQASFAPPSMFASVPPGNNMPPGMDMVHSNHAVSVTSSASSAQPAFTITEE